MTGFLKCLLCDKNTPNKYQLTQHIYQHLLYRKYQCTTCTELFYTQEEREAHCMRKGHVHTYEIKISPYCELYVNQLLKDVDFAALHGFDALIMQRSKANLACDVAMSKLPKSPYGLKRSASSPSGLEKALPSNPSTTRALLDGKRNADASPSQDPSYPSASKSKPSPKAMLPKPSDENCGESSSKPPKPTKNVRSREQNSPDDLTKIEVDNCPTISSATQLIGEALRTSPAEVRCTICKAMTPSEYVIRKQHVSSNHMPKDHTESDYIEILSDMMKKAYPTLTYNDLQCQIGGCHKEYKCMSSRRSHVQRIHFKNELSCPLNCTYRSNDFSLVNSHLKEDHGLRNGYMSIESKHVREQFNTARAKHNFLLNSLILQAFPCPIPDCYKTNNKTQTSSEFSPGDPVHNVISHLREKSRKFQNAPPNPLRLRSPSSNSDSSSERNDDFEGQTERNDDIAVKPSTVPSPAKTNENRPQLSAQVSAPSAGGTSGSSSDESDRDNSAATIVKARNTSARASTQPLNNVQSGNESVKRKRVASPSLSSSSSSLSSLSTPTRPSKNAGGPSQSVNPTNGKIQETKAEKERSSNDRNRAVNGSSSSSSSVSSESEGDVRVVKTVTSSSKRLSLSKPTNKPDASRIILDDDDDDDDDDQDEDVTFLSSKAGKKRTLAISGVSVRSAGVRASHTETVTRSAPPAGVKSRRLAISGVLVPIDKTPLSSFGKTTHNSERRFVSDSNVRGATVQVERKRELARRRFDIAEQRRAQRAALNKKRASMLKGDGGVKMGVLNRICSKKRKKVVIGKSPASGSRRHADGRDASSEKPSYVVEKVEEGSPPPRKMWYRRSS